MSTPNTKYVLVVPNDQTIGYITEDGAVTVLPSEACLFDTPEGAKEAGSSSHEENFYVEPVLDVTAFRAQAPEWGVRPASMQTIFGLARQIHEMLNNENLRTEKFEVRSEAFLLQSAAHVFMKELGHRTPDGTWTFGKAPS